MVVSPMMLGAGKRPTPWLNTITLRDDHLPPLAAARYTI
jgi:hypothetical protein